MTFESAQGGTPQAWLMRFLGELDGIAVEAGQRAAQRRKDVRRPRKGATLRPGEDTPLWAAVV